MVENFFDQVVPNLLIIMTVTIPIIYVTITGKFLKGVVLSWLLIMVFCLIAFVIDPAIYTYQHGESPQAKDLKPAFWMMLIYGWFPALLISTFGLGIKLFIVDVIRSLFNRKKTESTITNRTEKT